MPHVASPMGTDVSALTTRNRKLESEKEESTGHQKFQRLLFANYQAIVALVAESMIDLRLSPLHIKEMKRSVTNMHPFKSSPIQCSNPTHGQFHNISRKRRLTPYSAEELHEALVKWRRMEQSQVQWGKSMFATSLQNL